MHGNQHVPGFVFCSCWDFKPILVVPQVLCLDKIDPVFFTVGLTLCNIEFEVHPGIENIPADGRSSIREELIETPVLRSYCPCPWPQTEVLLLITL